MDKSKYNETKIENEDGTIVITLTPKNDAGWKPDVGSRYFIVGVDGDVEPCVWDDDNIDNERLKHGNVFPTREMAEKAARLQAVSNNIIMACLMVDPDFEPDWNDGGQRKYPPYYSTEGQEWRVGETRVTASKPAYVSTKEKAEQVCKRLTERGIKP